MKINSPFIPKCLTNNVVGLFLNCFLLVQLRDCSSRLSIFIGFRNKEKTTYFPQYFMSKNTSRAKL